MSSILFCKSAGVHILHAVDCIFKPNIVNDYKTSAEFKASSKSIFILLVSPCKFRVFVFVWRVQNLFLIAKGSIMNLSTCCKSSRILQLSHYISSKKMFSDFHEAPTARDNRLHCCIF